MDDVGRQVTLPKNLSCSVRTRQRWIGAGLGVVIVKILIGAEEPDAVALDGTAEARREIPVRVALVAPARDFDRLRGEAGGLSVVRRLGSETGASLFGHDIEHATLDVAVLH